MLLLKRFFCHFFALGFVALGLQAADWPQYPGRAKTLV
jgi:hypothetical protein